MRIKRQTEQVKQNKQMINEGLYSSKKQDWETPKDFFEFLDLIYHLSF
jgi:hypothetical protein